MAKLKLGIMGNGYLAGIVVDAYGSGMLNEYELVGLLGRTPEKTAALAEKGGCRACQTIEELLELEPDYIAEAASVQCIKDYAVKVLAAGASLIVLSIGAFADREFFETVKQTAKEYGTRVHMASGAVGGFDVLRTISLMGQAKAGIRTRKGPASLKGTPLFDEHLMTDTQESHVFEGNAKEAIALLPTKVNVAVATSLAATGPETGGRAVSGPEATAVNIFSVPGMVGDDHMITSEIEGVKAVVDIYSSTSAIAGWSVVAVLQNLVSPIVF